ncbi:MAG: hypothetical protein HZA16_10700 [Nitrospirae bacterium]|nr:hypothetical protein [Nitrospirota bacterium]
MNTHLNNLKINRRKLFAACLAGALSLSISAPAVQAHHEPLAGLTGPAFSDPSDLQEMPEAWIKQPVKHDAAAGSADIIINIDQHRETNKLVEYLLQHTEDIAPSYKIIPASLLKKAGWKFKENELVGEPR